MLPGLHALLKPPCHAEAPLTIAVHFHLNDEPEVSAITGVMGAVTDVLLPAVGDIVSHCSRAGVRFVGRVTSRFYAYEIGTGDDVDGRVVITLSLDRIIQH